MPLITAANLRLAPCTYCDRKPGFFADGKNYCYIHWYSKKARQNNNISIQSNKHIDDSESDVCNMLGKEK